jgi:hypothetical protein
MTNAFRKLSITGMTLAVMTSSFTAWADGVPITPGLWKVKTQNSMLGTEEVGEQCMRDEVFDPVSMLGKEEGCDITNETVAGNTVDYDLTCMDDTKQGRADGHFSFTIDGDQGSGKIDMTLNVGGQSMDITYKMDAERIGDC